MTTSNSSLFERRRAYGLLAAPLVLALAQTNPASAQVEEVGTTVCGSTEAREVYIGDEVQPLCEVLFGDRLVRDRNHAWRDERIMAVENGGLTLDIVHRDAQFRRPEIRTLPGMVIASTHAVEVAEEDCRPVIDDGADAAVTEGAEEELGQDFGTEHVAIVELSEPWATMCDGETVVLRVDDAIGSSGRVIYIGSHGVLAHLSGRLVWLSKMGSPTPTFRTMWQSGFSVVTDASIAKPAPKKKRKRRTKRRRR